MKHARYYWLLLAESHLTRRRFGAMLGRIALLPYRRDRWIVVQSAAESVYKLDGVRRGVAKVGHKWGQFWAVLVRMADRREYS